MEEIRTGGDRQRREKVPGFMVYRDAATALALMPDAQAGKAIKQVVRYFTSRVEPEPWDGPEGQVVELLLDAIDRNEEKYRRTVERNRVNACKRWVRADEAGPKEERQELPDGVPAASQPHASGIPVASQPHASGIPVGSQWDANKNQNQNSNQNHNHNPNKNHTPKESRNVSPEAEKGQGPKPIPASGSSPTPQAGPAGGWAVPILEEALRKETRYPFGSDCCARLTREEYLRLEKELGGGLLEACTQLAAERVRAQGEDPTAVDWDRCIRLCREDIRSAQARADGGGGRTYALR